MPPSRTSSGSKKTSAPYTQSKLSFTQTKPGPSLKQKKGKKEEAAPVTVSSSSEDEEDEEVLSAPASAQREKLDVADKAGRYRKHYTEVSERMGNIKPIHVDHQTKIHRILRVFDLSYEYGPCVGVTRLERWERANALGLEPPSEVREILLTDQGVDNPEFAQSVFYDADM